MIAKFNCTMAFYFYYLQSIELFPTCIRNSGLGFIGVMGLINFVAAIASSFLPETVGCDLPETLEAATIYGNDQSYFSYVNFYFKPLSSSLSCYDELELSLD